MNPISDHSLPKGSICVIGIPFDDHSSFMTGPAMAPPLIRESYYSSSANLWTESGLDLEQVKLLYDAGDIDFSGADDPFDLITASVGALVEKGAHPICLGGDHAVTFPIVKAFSGHYPNLNILHFDAHPDTYDILDGDRLSHACPFARIMENRLASRLVQAGIRTAIGHQKAQTQKFGIELHEIKDGFQWFDTLEFDGPVYLSVDMDCLDPAFAPGVSHYEPGGMSTRELLHMIQNIRGRLVGADIVEVNPKRDINGMTTMTAAKILKEIIAKIIESTP